MNPKQFLESLGCDYPDRRASSPKRRRLASKQAILRQVAAALQLPKGSYQIRSCMGGSAVEADAILHSENLYINLCGSGHAYMRRCKDLKDYCGERNHSVPDRYDAATLIAMAKSILGR